MPAASTVEATTTAATMESATATTVVSTGRAAMITTAAEAASHCGAVITASVSTTVSATITITAPVAVTVPAAIAVVSATIAVDATVSVAITTTEPRASADEDTAVKPGWAVVPIRSAGVGSIAVVTISANRSRIAVAPVHRATDANSD
jgi:hypothetical protein